MTEEISLLTPFDLAASWLSRQMLPFQLQPFLMMECYALHNMYSDHLLLKKIYPDKNIQSNDKNEAVVVLNLILVCCR